MKNWQAGRKVGWEEECQGYEVGKKELWAVVSWFAVIIPNLSILFMYNMFT